MKRLVFLLVYLFALAPYGHACIYDGKLRLAYDVCAIIGLLWFLQNVVAWFKRRRIGGVG